MKTAFEDGWSNGVLAHHGAIPKHVFDLDVFCSEIHRVLRPQATIMFTLALKQWGSYESLRIDDLAEITEHFPDFTVVHTNDTSEDWAKSGGLNFAVILQRKGQAE